MEFFSSIQTAFVSGGIWMWVILVMQVVAIGIVIERSLALYKNRKLGELAFSDHLEGEIKKGNLQKAFDDMEADEANHPLAKAARAGLRAAMNLGGKDEIQGKMDEVLLNETTQLEKRTAFLAMLANVGTLTGLLGTIVGMIKSFAAVAYANPTEKATLLADGIAIAMNTTAYGLIMAIPTLVMFAILTNRTTELSEDLNQGALKVYNWLSYAYEPVSVRHGRVNSQAQGVQTEANA